MSEPIVFISTHKIKEGKLDGFRERNRQVLKGVASSTTAVACRRQQTDGNGAPTIVIDTSPPLCAA